jgi:hypothetical protein
VWGAPFEVATVLNVDHYSYLQSVQCVSVLHCTATGAYSDAQGHSQVFVISEVNGFWGSPLTLVSALNVGGNAYPNEVSCASSTNCAIVGRYTQGGANDTQGFVVEEVNGHWGAGYDLTSTLNLGMNAEATSISCTTPGNCVAGGYFSNLDVAPFVLAHAHVVVRSLPALRAPRGTLIISHDAFIAAEHGGYWNAAVRVAHDLNVGKDARVTTVSCVDESNCLVSGYYRDASSFRQIFAMTQVAGTWHNATELLGVQNIGGNAVTATSTCSFSGYCVLGGYFSDTVLDPQAFVISKMFSPAQIIIDPFREGSFARSAHINAQIRAAAVLIASHHLSSVTVIGHTDSLDSHHFNLTLGLARAAAVRHQLLIDLLALGDPHVTVFTATKGDTQFVASNATASGRALNRRVVIAL